MYKFKKYTPALVFLTIAILFVVIPELLFAKDFASGVRSAETKITDILVVMGPVALAVAAGAFYFSRQMGTNLLISAVIGIVLFASAPSLFRMIYDNFR